MSNSYKLADDLYRAGYIDAKREFDYDPRGSKEWQDVVDAMDSVQEILLKVQDKLLLARLQGSRTDCNKLIAEAEVLIAEEIAQQVGNDSNA